MHMPRKIALSLLGLALTSFAFAQVPQLNTAGYYEGEGITFNAQTGKYVIQYLDYGDLATEPLRMIALEYEAPNNIKPELTMRLKAGVGRDVTYSFDVRNGRPAKQPIYTFSFYTQTPWFENSSLITHSAATAQAIAGNLGAAAQTMESSLTYVGRIEDTRMKQPEKWLPDVKFAKTNKAFVMSWQAHPNKLPLDDIQPGQHRNGYGVVLPYLPGLVQFSFKGDAPALKFPGAAGGDSKIWKDIDKLLFRGGAPRPSVSTLGPKILIPEPFNAKLLSMAIADDLQSWVTAGQLSEPLAQKLRATLAAIGDAAERNNERGVTENTKQIFVELLSRHEGMQYAECGEESEAKRQDHRELSYLAARAIGFNAFELLKRYSYTKNKAER